MTGRRRRPQQPDLWAVDEPVRPAPPAAAPVVVTEHRGVPVCTCLSRGRGSGFSLDWRGYWVHADPECRRPTLAWLAWLVGSGALV